MSRTRPALDQILTIGPHLRKDRGEPVRNSDGRFVAVGSATDVIRAAYAGTRIVDCNERRMIPGQIDSHIHMTRRDLPIGLACSS